MRIEFTIPGAPQGKQRARSGNGHHYTPQKTRDYEAIIRMHAHMAMQGQPPVTGPARVHIVASVPMPVSWSDRKRKATVNTPCMSKPDWDNIGKVICDAINGIVYADDKQVTYASVEKYWGVNGCVDVEVHT